MGKWIILLAGMGLLAGCSTDTREYQVADVTKPAVIILKKRPEQGSIYALSITGEGTIEGNATITLVLNGAPYKTEKLSGTVDFRWGGDWYGDSAEIRYSPGQVSGGRLILNYTFSD